MYIVSTFLINRFYVKSLIKIRIKYIGVVSYNADGNSHNIRNVHHHCLHVPLMKFWSRSMFMSRVLYRFFISMTPIKCLQLNVMIRRYLHVEHLNLNFSIKTSSSQRSIGYSKFCRKLEEYKQSAGNTTMHG